jgi:hypothetical protein
MSTSTIAVPPRPDLTSLPVDDTGWPIVPPTLVTVHRTSAADEQSRQIVCALDGQRIAVLLYGQQHTQEIPPGPHTLRVHNTLMWKTLRFEVEPGAHVRFTVSNRAPTGYYHWIFIFGVSPLWLAVEKGGPAK